MPRDELSYCRICAAACGIVVTVDGDEVVRVRGDDDHPVSRGYTCSKGRGLPAWHHAPDRLDRPQLRGREVAWDGPAHRSRASARRDHRRVRAGRRRALSRDRTRVRRRRPDRGGPVPAVDRQQFVLHRGHRRQRPRARRGRARCRRSDAQPRLGPHRFRAHHLRRDQSGGVARIRHRAPRSGSPNTRIPRQRRTRSGTRSAPNRNGRARRRIRRAETRRRRCRPCRARQRVAHRRRRRTRAARPLR